MKLSLLALAVLLFAAACGAPSTPTPSVEPPVATFSIVAYDPETKCWGVAVQSKVVAAAAIVNYAKANHGAIATQSYANVAYGPDGLAMLAKGTSAEDVVEALTKADKGKDYRQLGIVDQAGNAATFTGKSCTGIAADQVGKHYAVQGNTLASDKVIPAMAEAFEKAEGDLGERMIEALRAGQKAGGDKRGRQAAGLLVVHEGWGYGGGNDRYRDVRVDDHKTPIEELARVYAIHKSIFKPKR